jgi:hypothetical protein
MKDGSVFELTYTTGSTGERCKQAYMSSEDSLVCPMATACSLPSAKTPYTHRDDAYGKRAGGRRLQGRREMIVRTTTDSAGTSSILPPGDVSPGHMTLAPDITNLIAPRSTCILGRMSGSSSKINQPPFETREQDRTYICEEDVGWGNKGHLARKRRESFDSQPRD